MIAYMSGKDVPDGAATIKPKGSPFKDYEGWCFALQEYLAGRIGCSEKSVNRSIGILREDRVIDIRSRKTKRAEDGYVIEHYEYKIDQSVVDAHQRPEGGERQPSGKKAGTKAFSKKDDSASSRGVRGSA
jgi:biotin operon repressor